MNRDFHELLSVLSANKVDFLVVGAYALAAHGLPRFTGDLDIWVRPSEANAQNVWNALLRFGVPLNSVTPADFRTPNTVFRMGFPPSQVDILSSISGVEFDEAWNARISATIEGLEVYVISPRDMILNKRSANRPKDLLDANDLERKFGTA